MRGAIALALLGILCGAWALMLNGEDLLGFAFAVFGWTCFGVLALFADE